MTISPASPTLSRIVTPAGHDAWMVLDYETVRALLGDPRLGLSHDEPDRAGRLSDSVVFGRPAQRVADEAADHKRMRRLLAQRFSARRLAAMRPWMAGLVDDVLDGLDAAGSPADFHELVSFPLPAMVISDLLGVPFAHRERFRQWSDEAADMYDRERSAHGLTELAGYVRELVEKRLAAPSDDLLSDLVRAHLADPSFTLEKVTTLGMTVLFAGHETTVTAIDTGAVLLGSSPAERRRLSVDATAIPAAVEEILRGSLPRTSFFAPIAADDVGGALPRWATVDFRLGDQQIARGDMVLLGLAHANGDRCLVGTNGGFDPTRDPNPHLTFGHGPHFCAGAPLARLELEELFGRLVTRFPNLTLDVPIDALHPRDNLLTGGLDELPMRW